MNRTIASLRTLSGIAPIFAGMAALCLSGCAAPRDSDANPKADAIVGKWECKSNYGGDSIDDTFTFLPNGTGTQRTVSRQAGLKEDVTRNLRWTYDGKGTWTSKHEGIQWICEYRLSHGDLMLHFNGGGTKGVLMLTRAH